MWDQEQKHGEDQTPNVQKTGNLARLVKHASGLTFGSRQEASPTQGNDISQRDIHHQWDGIPCHQVLQAQQHMKDKEARGRMVMKSR